MKKSKALPVYFIDPVCLMRVNPRNQDINFTYKTRTYYFCSEACCKAFAIDPGTYIPSKPLTSETDNDVILNDWRNGDGKHLNCSGI